VTDRTTNRELAERLEVLQGTVTSIQQQVCALQEQLREVRSALERTQLILCGDGLQGLTDRVGTLEEQIWRNDPSILSRLQALEQHIDRFNKVAWALLALVASQLTLAVLRLIGI